MCVCVSLPRGLLEQEEEEEEGKWLLRDQNNFSLLPSWSSSTVFSASLLFSFHFFFFFFSFVPVPFFSRVSTHFHSVQSLLCSYSNSSNRSRVESSRVGGGYKRRPVTGQFPLSASLFSSLLKLLKRHTTALLARRPHTSSSSKESMKIMKKAVARATDERNERNEKWTTYGATRSDSFTFIFIFSNLFP